MDVALAALVFAPALALGSFLNVVAARLPERRSLVKPRSAGVKQEPPLPVVVELARGATEDAALAEAIREKLRSVLVVQARVDLVPWGSLRRSEYKSTLVER